jgi:hypothetical protein
MTKEVPCKKPTPPAGTPGKPMPSRSKIVSRKCLGMEDLDRLDRMRRELFEADAARWQKDSRTKDDLIAAFGYWIGYPMFLEAVGHDWRTDETRTTAYYALNSAHTLATHVLMEEAEKHGLDPHALYECARVVQEIYADEPEKYYAGRYDTWPECMGTARYSLPAGQQDALRAGEAVFIRLSVKAGVDRTVKPSLPPVGPGSMPGAEGEWSIPMTKARMRDLLKMTNNEKAFMTFATEHGIRQVGKNRQLWQIRIDKMGNLAERFRKA